MPPTEVKDVTRIVFAESSGNFQLDVAAGHARSFVYRLEIGPEVEHFIRAYCAANDVVFNEAIVRALKLLKVAEDGKYRGEQLALVKNVTSSPSIETITGY